MLCEISQKFIRYDHNMYIVRVHQSSDTSVDTAVADFEILEKKELGYYISTIGKSIHSISILCHSYHESALIIPSYLLSYDIYWHFVF